MKRLHVLGELCNGCAACQTVCSFVNTREFNPRKALINVVRVESLGYAEAITDCDGAYCLKEREGPLCVEFCRTGALVYCDIEELAHKKLQLQSLRERYPEAKVRAPWAM